MQAKKNPLTLKVINSIWANQCLKCQYWNGLTKSCKLKIYMTEQEVKEINYFVVPCPYFKPIRKLRKKNNIFKGK